jgi:hypothetical protein
MKGLTATRAFWIALALVVYPLLFAVLLVLVIMPPLNMIAIPIWFFVIAGAIGGITRGLDEARRAAHAPAEDRRYAPGVVPVQRTNAR